MIRIAGRELLALPFALLVIVNTGAAQPGQQSKDQQNLPVKKAKQLAQILSEREISEAREPLDQLGYWINPDAKRLHSHPDGRVAGVQ